MKRILALAFFAAALISVGGANANAQSLEFKVPFDFTVQSRAFPAGTYWVSHAAQNVIFIQSRDMRFHTMAVTYAAYDTSPSGAELVFKKYGDKYFLHDVLCSAADLNGEIPESKLEEQTRTQQAQLPHGETVAVLRAGVK
ncbi:hypothetical protein [Alloacidobacterium sp.]|uniref:hypothetical protein n=1 Tax=Alloacidobacterium sp. TaxID=2951999 RepID=UPI002D74741E|nr:hypothetical protein [Alloacidobacterium sp.]HYK36017.1 hypothetical protein [Alloacidobacterium sp.]